MISKFIKFTMIVFTIFCINAFTGITASALDSGINSRAIKANVESTAVHFNDINLENCIRSALNKPTGDITPEDMASIKSLEAGNASIKDLNGIEYAVNLTQIFLGNNQITDISPLSNLTNLEFIILSGNSVCNIDALASLSHLANLQISCNRVCDISPLMNLTNLNYLNLSYNGINDISQLSGLKNLVYLSLDGNPINDISVIANFKELQSLDLRSIVINSLDPLSECTKLVNLNLMNNQISDISTLSNLTNLECVCLSNNNIIDIKPLENLTMIKSLDITSNLVEDISPLLTIANNGGFQPNGEINIRYNNIDISEGSQTYDNIIMELIRRGITVNYSEQNIGKKVTRLGLNYNDLIMKPKEMLQLTASIYPFDAANQNLIWTSDKPEIASVDQTGMITGLHEGEAVITVTAEDGGCTDQCRVTVTENYKIVYFPDNKLEQAVRAAIGKDEGDITSIDMSKLLKLIVPWQAGVKNLTGLEYAVNLSELYVQMNEISDLKPLANLNALNTLYLSSNQIYDITPLSNLTNLKIVALDDNRISDISTLSNLQNVEYLYLDYNMINSIQLLSNLKKLKELSFSSNKVRDISPLVNFKDLLIFRAGANGISDISPLAGLTELEELNLSDNKITNINVLGNLINLKHLYLYKNLITDIKALSNLNKLLDIDVSDNLIKDISPLAGLTDPTYVGIGNNPLQDISLITRFKKLKYIRLESLNLNNLDILLNFPELYYADLDDNLISDIGPLTNLVNLGEISLCNNKIKDISEMSKMSNLAVVRINNNYIEDISPLENLHKLSWVYIDNNYLKDVSPILNAYENGLLPELRIFEFRQNYVSINKGTQAYDQIMDMTIKMIRVIFLPKKGSEKVNGVTIDKRTVSIDLGNEFELNALITPEDSENCSVVWSSSDPEIVRVYSNGAVRGLKEGTAVITAKTEEGGYTAVCDVTVVNPIPATEIIIKNNYMKVGIGEPHKIEYTLLPANATNKNVIWSSNDESIARVDSEGNVYGVKKGKTTIIGTIVETNISAVFTVEVIPVEKVAISESFIQTNKGSKIKLSAVISPETAVNCDVIWTSSNPNVVSVDSSGNIEALKSGEAAIYAKSVENFNIYGECKVVVAAEIHVSSIKLNINKAGLSTTPGYNTVQLSALVAPDNATNKNIEWISKYPEIASVDINGTVTAKKPGKTIITAKTDGGRKTASCTITVAPVSEVKLNKTNISIAISKSATLKATILPSNAAIKNIQWSVSQGDSVVVTSSGKVMPIKPGTSTITVATLDGGKTASCTVIVTGDNKVKVTDISIKEVSPVIISTGKKYTIKPTLIGENRQKPTNPNILWKSSNENIAIVDDSGKITAKAPGTAVISITALGGDNIAKEVTIEVVQPISSIAINKSLKLAVGNTAEITAIIYPYNITQQDISIVWSKSDRSNILDLSGSTAIEIDPKGNLVIRANVKAIKKGSASVSLVVKTKDGIYKKVSCSISIK